MLIPVGDTVLKYNGIFHLTESGKQLWEQIQNGAEKEDLVEFLQKEYEIDFATADEDVTSFIEKLSEFEMI